MHQMIAAHKKFSGNLVDAQRIRQMPGNVVQDLQDLFIFAAVWQVDALTA